MEYSDGELKYWWRGLTVGDRRKLLDDIQNNALAEHIRLAAMRLAQPMLDADPKDLVLVRRWWHR